MLFLLSCYHQSFFINYFTATEDKSQRPVLGIADTNKKLETSNLFPSSSLESGKSPSNSISSALSTNENDGKLMIAFSQLDMHQPLATMLKPQNVVIILDTFLLILCFVSRK